MNGAADLRLSTRACGALAVMSARYWTTAARQTKRHLRRWREEAEAIPDLTLRELALTKLAEEQTNAYFATTFATLAPRPQRASAIEAIVALQIIYDYLDGLTEQPSADPLCNGLELFRALSDAVSPAHQPHHEYYSRHPRADDGGYLSRLVTTARGALAKLPATTAVSDIARAAAARCAEAQVRAHSAASLGTTQLEQWASEQARDDGASWQVSLAGAASAIISIHALVAAAAQPGTTREPATLLNTFYRRSTCTLATILDGLADRGRDQRSAENQIGYLHYFPETDLLSGLLVGLTRQALQEAPYLPHAGHHLMTLSGVVAYYTSALEHSDDSSKAIVAPLQRELKPMITPTLAFMRAWRLGQRLQRPRKDSPDLVREHDSAPGRRPAADAPKDADCLLAD